MKIVLNRVEKSILNSNPPESALGFDLVKNKPRLLVEFSALSTDKLDSIHLRIWEVLKGKNKSVTPKIFEYGFTLNNNIKQGYVQHESITYCDFIDDLDIEMVKNSPTKEIEKVFLKYGGGLWPNHEGNLMDLFDYTYLVADSILEWQEGVNEVFFIFRSKTDSTVFKIITQNLKKY